MWIIGVRREKTRSNVKLNVSKDAFITKTSLGLYVILLIRFVLCKLLEEKFYVCLSTLMSH